MKNIVNIANSLTFFRVCLSVPLWHFLSSINENSNIYVVYWFLGLCLLISLTDILDGYFARLFNSVTDIGKFLDPIADKICVLVFVVYLSMKFGISYSSLFLALLVRDIIISVVSIYFVRKEGRYFQANIYGKWFLFFIAISMILEAVRIPNIINQEYIYLNTLNSIFYVFSWIFFILATYKYFSTYYYLLKKNNV